MTDEVANFYDELTPYYDLIFEDWEASMQRQGAVIASLLERYLPAQVAPLRILDAAAGIGTQSLPLAARGFDITSRDLSAAAIARLRREANARQLSIDAAQCDMRNVAESIRDAFDAVIAFDNSVPHLLNDDEILKALASFHKALRPSGICGLSVRDYETVKRGEDAVHAYGVRLRNGVRYLPLQAWRWIDDDHYELDFFVIVDNPAKATVLRTSARYYAVSKARLLELMMQAGFIDTVCLSDAFYQPVVIGRKPL